MASRDYLSRQIAFLGAKGRTVSQIAGALGDQVEPGEVEELLRGERGPADGDVLLPLVLRQFDQDDEALTASVSFHQFKSDLAEITASARGMLAGLAGYAALIGSVALIVFWIFARFVIPTFDNLFASFGADLPALTRAVINLSNLAFSFGVLLLVLPFAVTLWLILATHKIRRVLALSDRPGWLLSAVSPHRGLLKFHCRLIHLWLTKQAHAMGRSLADSLELGDRVIREYSGRREAAMTGIDRASLRNSEAIGTLPEELDHQVASTMMEMPMKLVRQRAVLQLVVQVLLAIGIGTIVIALYLPIFKMAALI